MATVLAHLVEDAISKGVEFDVKEERVLVKLPKEFPPEEYQRLKAAGQEVRLLIKLRLTSEWLTCALHGEAEVTGDKYGTWLDVFVGADRMLRELYGFEGCLFGTRTCAGAAVLCEACAL
jgi:hypothetical protein